MTQENLREMFASAVVIPASSVPDPKRSRIEDTAESQEDLMPIDVQDSVQSSTFSDSDSDGDFSGGPQLGVLNEDNYVEYDRCHRSEEHDIDIQINPSPSVVHQTASCCEVPRGPSDISQAPSEEPVICKEPRSGYPKSFPTGSAARTFKPHWAKINNWLEYSTQTDMIYCHPCRHFGSYSNPKWEGEGSRFNNW